MAKILLLEDDAGLRFTFTSALKEEGHSVVAVDNIPAALATFEFEKPEIILLDLLIDGSTSIEIANFAAYAVPTADVIFITGSKMFSGGELFQLIQNTRLVLRKPVQIPELLEVVEHVSRNPSNTGAQKSKMVS